MMPGRTYTLHVGILWAVLTVLGEVLVFRTSLLPVAAAREAEIVDSAFQLLLVLGVPVFAFVMAVLIYALWRFRGRGEPPEDGPSLRGRPAVIWAWLAVTAGLAVYVIFNPGLKGLAELRADPRGELVVRVEGSRWFWRISYPEHGITRATELVLPVKRRVRLEVTATDVVHSFWVPAFRIKLDAVPGMVTTAYLTPTVAGTRDENVNFRLQCAEMCGVGHAIMTSPVRVLEQAEFDAWVAQQK